MNCIQCNSITNNPKFCNASCAAKFNNKLRKPRSESSRSKVSLALRGCTRSASTIAKLKAPRPKYDGEYTPIKQTHCTCCGRSFYYKTKVGKRQTCSPECSRINSTYRKIVHPYQHNGTTVLLESSWEVDIALFLDYHNFNWVRPKHIKWTDSSGKNRKYFPDFYLPDHDLYLDPKNLYQISISTEKLQLIGSKVNLVYGNVDYIKDELSKLC